MLVVALTGGIGSGKSTVAARLATLGVPVIDADVIARQLVIPGSPALEEIAATLGEDLIAANGSLDRSGLRERVFADDHARRELERILHPRIRDEILRCLSRLDAPYAVLVIPLLLESGQTDLADRILVVDLPETLQIERVRRRNDLSESQVRAIMSAQCDRSRRHAAADDLIDNSGDLEHLMAATDGIHQRYLQLATAGAR